VDSGRYDRPESTVDHDRDYHPGMTLVRCAHPGPALAVTLVGVLLGVAADLPAATLVLLGAALLAGQLSIGWSNDAIDAGRDAEAGRQDKPLAQQRVSRRTVAVAAGAALAVTVPLSLALGPWAGVTHLACVASAWSYNLWLKSTPWSWLPFAFSFGLLPAVVTFTLPGHPWPAPWVMVAAGLLGVGAHLVNVLPDLDQDDATGVRGAAHRLGGPAAAVVATVVLVGAVGVVVVAPEDAGTAEWAGLLAAAALGASAVVSALTGRRLPAIASAAAIAVLAIGLLVGQGSSLLERY
jgi:4-hydroxybenzoate polyprenyltransferase